MWILRKILTHFLATIFICSLAHGDSFYNNKPWPTYSLQNMPKTRFSCHDKILGGYYADAETQCQMFHVCVKIAGVGVQDFRFLCPNGTAFDQEAQICAYWADVDCERAVLYYGSDNFDLYRIGSGYESKRAPLAEEEESTFHLQRAESADLRRSKETRVDQKTRPEQHVDYTATLRHFNSQQQAQQNRIEVTKKPIVSYYTPTTSKATTTTTTTEKYYNGDESKQEYDDIFKGSHSSHFFANRNGGREDDFIDHPQRKHNDFTDYSKKAETSTISKTRVHTTRIKRPHTTTSTTTTTTTTIAPPPSPNSSKKTTIQTFFGTNYFGFSPTSTTVGSTSTSTTTSRPVISNAQRFNLNVNDFPEKIKSTTHNSVNSIFRLKTTTPKHADGIKNINLDNSRKTKITNKPAISSRNAQQKTEDAKLITQKPINEFQKLKVQQPQPFQPSPIFRPPPVSSKDDSKTNAVTVKSVTEPQIVRVRGQPLSPINKQEPSPFASPQRTRGTTTDRSKISTSAAPIQNPRGFTSRGSINYRTSTIKAADSSYVQTSAQLKKFSTLVTQYASTPAQKKHNEFKVYQTPQTTQITKKTQKLQTTTSTTPLPNTANPYYSPDEDDGQYHPELYEVDYSYDRYNLQRSSKGSTSASTTTTTTSRPVKKVNIVNNNNPQVHLKTQQQSAFQKQQQEQVSSGDLSDEDELFKTAQSLNFGAASINKLRADIMKAEKNSQQYNSQYSPQSAPTASPITASTIAPYFSYATNAAPLAVVTSKSFNITAATTTTQRTVPTTISTTTTARYYENVKSTKSTKLSKDKGLGKKINKKTSKRPPHADEDTSYDYAYYDTDTLSESPQDYPEYNIQEFTKTRKN